MGILADIFVATREDALHYETIFLAEQKLPTDCYERVEYKGFTGLEFGTLWAIMAGKHGILTIICWKYLTHGEEGETRSRFQVIH